MSPINQTKNPKEPMSNVTKIIHTIHLQKATTKEFFCLILKEPAFRIERRPQLLAGAVYESANRTAIAFRPEKDACVTDFVVGAV